MAAMRANPHQVSYGVQALMRRSANEPLTSKESDEEDEAVARALGDEKALHRDRERKSARKAPRVGVLKKWLASLVVVLTLSPPPPLSLPLGFLLHRVCVCARACV